MEGAAQHKQLVFIVLFLTIFVLLLLPLILFLMMSFVAV